MKKKLLIAALMLMGLCGAVFGGIPVSAATNNTVELKKALLADLRHCYMNSKMKADLGVLSNYTSYLSIIQNDGGEKYVKLPNGYTDINDNDLSCSQLLNGYSGMGGSFEGLFALAGITPPVNASSVAEKESFLAGMGYERTEGSAGQCVAFYYRVNTTNSAPFVHDETEEYEYTYQLCSPIVNADGTIGVDKMEVVKEGGTEIVEFEIRTNSVTLDCALYNFLSQGGCGEHKFTKDATNWDEFVDEILSDLAEHYNSKTTVTSNGGMGSYSYTYTLQTDVKRTSYGTVNATYKLKSSMEDAANEAIKYLSAYSSGSDLYYSPAEQVVLYQTYLEDYYKADIRCDRTGDELTMIEAQGYAQVRIWRNGVFNDDCWALADRSNADKNVNGLTDARWFTQERSFAEIAAALKSSAVATLTTEQAVGLGDTVTDEPLGVDNPATVTPEEPEGEAEVDPCFANGGAIGWIICPVVDFMDNAMSWLYGWVEYNFLQVNTVVFETGDSDEENVVFQMWSTFQGIANIMFVVLLLVVIFSQLTGFGIDNYGIKKILPKLIIGILLINLSYILCMILVDLSNILGWGLRSLLDSMGPAAVGESSSAGQNFLVFGALGIGAVVFVIANPAILLTFAVFLLSVVIAVLFMWIILVVRQAGVIIMVALAPIACACYLLPNTKKLFDRWVSIMKGLLLVFPLCSLVVGGGALAGRILAVSGDRAGNEAFVLAAMVLSVAPFFFVPALLKGSLAGLGNIGAKISGIGKGLSGSMDKRIKGSDWYKDKQLAGRAQGARNTRAVAGALEKSKLGQSKFGKSKFGRAVLLNSAGRQRANARAIAAQDKQKRENIAAQALFARDRDPSTLTEAAFEDSIAEMLVRGRSESAAAETTAAMSRLGNSKGSAVLRRALERAQADPKFQKSKAERDFMSLINEQHGSAIAKKDYALGQTLSSGGYSPSGAYTSAASLASTLGRGEMKPEEAATLSKGSLARAFSSGAVTQDMASRVLGDEALRRQIDSDAMDQWQAIAQDKAAFSARGSVPSGSTTPLADDRIDLRSGEVLSIMPDEQVRLTHEQTAQLQGKAGGMFAGRSTYRTPAGFKPTSRTTNSGGDLVMVNARGEKWNSHKGIYEK